MQSSLSAEARESRDRRIMLTLIHWSFEHQSTFHTSGIPQRLGQMMNRLELGFSVQLNENPFLHCTKISDWRQMANWKVFCMVDMLCTYQWRRRFVERRHSSSNEDKRACMIDSMRKILTTQKMCMLRRLVLCPQLNAKVNSESHEQLHSVMNKDNYFLNIMQPATLEFMKRYKFYA